MSEQNTAAAFPGEEISRHLEIFVSDDLLSASIVFRQPNAFLADLDREQLKKLVTLRLRQQRVSYGIDVSVLDGELDGEQEYIVARGKPAIDGQDSEIRMIELPDRNPEVQQDGSTNFYNVNLALPVSKDDWLGEKRPPVQGSAGVNVKGQTIAPKEGKDFILLYDSESVVEEEEGELTVLRALKSGMVHLQDDKISVLSHRDFENIDFSTGNVDFQGSVTIRGVVMDGFSVKATGDINILGPMGIGAVAEIVSTEGSIFIKGGIAGNGKAVVKAAHDIFTKFVLDSTLECDGKISIGFFCRNSHLKAEELIVESSRGRIQGGRVEAKTLITANEAGSEMEARTELYIIGFRHEQLEERLEKLREEWNGHKQQLDSNRSNLNMIGGRTDIESAVKKKLTAAIKERMAQSLSAMKVLENEMKNVQRYLRMQNEGEIRIRKINPNCFLSHDGLGYEIREVKIGRVFYCNAGLLMEK